MDPFASPEQSTSHDEPLIVVAVSDAVAGLLRNAPGWIAILLASIAINLAGVITVLGWVVTVPLVTWGTTAFALQAIDGRARFGALFDGWSDLGRTLSRVWGMMIIIGVATVLIGLVPFLALTFPELTVMAAGGEPDDVIFTVKTGLVELFLALLLVRFELALPLIVERDRPLLASLTESWQRTGVVWGSLVGLVLLHQLLGLPATVLQLGLQRMVPNVFDVENVLANAPAIVGTWSAAFAIATFANVFFMMCAMSAYRRLVGPAPDQETT